MTTATQSNPQAEGRKGRRSPDAPPPSPDVAAMRDCLVRLRERLHAHGRRHDVAEIDAVLAGDDDAQVRILMGSAPLTPRQVEILGYVWRYRRQHGISPTLGEIAAAHGISKVTTMEHLDALQDKGVAVRDPHRSRSIVLLNECGGDCGEGAGR